MTRLRKSIDRLFQWWKSTREKRRFKKRRAKEICVIKKRINKIETTLFLLRRRAEWMINIPSEALNLSQINGKRIKLIVKKNELINELSKLNI